MKIIACMIALLAACASAPSEQRAVKRLEPRPNEDGLSEETAITVPNVRAEYEWLRARRCPGGGAWKVRLQSLAGGEPPCFIDRLTAVCDSSGEERAFYFRGCDEWTLPRK